MGKENKMKVLLLTFLSVVVSTLAHPDYSESFGEFKEKFGKEYESDEEENHRSGIWSSNVDFIKEHNQQAEAGVHSFHVGENALADLSTEEIQIRFNGYILTLLLDPATVDQVAPPLLDLLGVSEEDHHFLQIDFLPAIRNASSHHYLGLRDRLELGGNTFASLEVALCLCLAGRCYRLWRSQSHARGQHSRG